MNRRLSSPALSLLLLVTIIIIAALLYIWFQPPSAEYHQYNQPLSVDNPMLDEQVIRDLQMVDGQARLILSEGKFFTFNFSVIGQDGSDYGIVYLASDGHYSLIWRGQDFPPCGPVERHGVPRALVPYCFQTKLVDRSNLLRELYSKVFSPDLPLSN